MGLLQIVVTALVQGITEFLPISSDAHLVLLPRIAGWCDQGLLVDVAVHVGTLLAVVVYFWRECLSLLGGAAGLARGRMTKEGRLFIALVIATIPVVVAGYAFQAIVGDELRSVRVIAWTTLVFGIVLWAADRWGPRFRAVEQMTWGAALLIGLAQVVALLPGTSRSGITMTAARALGFERKEAARFSMLMAIPVIIAAGTLVGLEIAATGNARLTGDALLAAALSFVTALVAVAALMRWLRYATFAPFVIYRVLLGVALLAAVYGFGWGVGTATVACAG